MQFTLAGAIAGDEEWFCPTLAAQMKMVGPVVDNKSHE